MSIKIELSDWKDVNMTSLRKILTITALLFAITVLFSFIGFHLGYSGLLLVGELDMPVVVKHGIQFILFSINITIIGSISLNVYSTKIFKIFAVYYIIDFIVGLFICNIINSGFMPIAYILICGALRKDLKSTIKRLFLTWLFVILFELMTITVKIGYFWLGYNQVSIYQGLMFSIDLIIFLILLYCIGGERYYGKLAEQSWRQTLVLLFSPEEISTTREDIEDGVAEAQWRTLTGFRRAKAVSLLLAFQIMQWILILFICKIGNVLIEGIAITTAFIVYGTVIKRKWHSPNIWICTLISAVMFYIAARTIPSFYYSELFPTVAGLFLVYALYRIALYTDRKNELEEYITKLHTFKLEPNCNEDEFMRVAIAKGMNNIDIELLRYRYCKNYNWSQMEIKFAAHGSKSTIKRYVKAAESAFYAV